MRTVQTVPGHRVISQDKLVDPSITGFNICNQSVIDDVLISTLLWCFEDGILYFKARVAINTLWSDGEISFQIKERVVEQGQCTGIVSLS